MNDRLKGRPTDSQLANPRGAGESFCVHFRHAIPVEEAEKNPKIGHSSHARKKIRKETGREVLKKVNGKHRAFS